MEWLYPKRRGPQWKQGWTGQTLSSVYISTPPLPLLTIFGIVIFLLWLSQSTEQKSQLQHSAINLQIFAVLLPITLIIFVASYSTNWSGYFQFRNPLQSSIQRVGSELRSGSGSGSRSGSGSSPWGIAIFVVLLLLLLSYQSYFHSQWFGPFRGSN